MPARKRTSRAGTSSGGMGSIGGGMPSHDTGIEGHVLIKVAPGIDIWQAFDQISATNPTNVHGGTFTLIHLHVALGEIDFLADVHCSWTSDPGMGWETHVLGDWVNQIRKLKQGGENVVASTSTNVCMNH
jgi:hypothetical protein